MAPNPHGPIAGQPVVTCKWADRWRIYFSLAVPPSATACIRLCVTALGLWPAPRLRLRPLWRVGEPPGEEAAAVSRFSRLGTCYAKSLQLLLLSPAASCSLELLPCP